VNGTPTHPNTCNMGVTPTWDAFAACAAAKCNTECVAKPCNPVTNEGCDTAMGEACDLDMSGTFYRCFPPPNDAKLCAACPNGTSFCAPTLHCLTDVNSMNAQCYRYCCDDGDCGGGGCDKSFLPKNLGVGVCFTLVDGGLGFDPACSAPAQALSNGSCFMGSLPPSDAGSG
jgi:hypothetical protein